MLRFTVVLLRIVTITTTTTTTTAIFDWQQKIRWTESKHQQTPIQRRTTEFKDRTVPKEPNELQDDMTPLIFLDVECLQTNVQIQETKKNVIASFKVAGSHDCWRYCKMMTKCVVISYDTFTGECTLSKQNYSKTNTTLAGTRVIVEKPCTDRTHGVEKEEIARLSSDQNGVLIMQCQDRLALRCLNARKQSADERKDPSYTLLWETCYGADSWLVEEVDHGTSTVSTTHYQISLAKDPGQCIDVEFNDSLATVFLSHCREIQQQNRDHQVLFIIDAYTHTAIYMADPVSLYSVGQDALLILHTSRVLDERQQLEGILFQDPLEYPKFDYCPVTQFDIARGKARNDDMLPFFLPGSKVIVECEGGFGVRKLNYSSIQEVVCSENTKVHPCKRVKTKSEFTYCSLYLAIGVLALIGCVVLLALLFIPALNNKTKGLNSFVYSTGEEKVKSVRHQELGIKVLAQVSSLTRED